MIQDITGHIYNNQYIHSSITQDSIMMVMDGEKLLAKVEDNTVSYVNYIEGLEYEYLFSIDSIPYYFVVQTDSKLLELLYSKGYLAYTQRQIMRFTPQHLAYAGITAMEIIRFYTTRKYCGRCGYPMIRSTIERRMDCPVCKNVEYPKISPCVIVGVIYENSILLTQYNGGRMYALVAGFNEVGETIEETVHREVREETGIEVDHLHYYKSQPWALSDSLLFGFYCEAKHTDIIVDHSELATAQFVSQQDIPDYLDAGSLTAEMIMNFKANGRKVLN